MGLLDASASGGGLACGLGGKLLAGSLASSGAASGLLGASHDLTGRRGQSGREEFKGGGWGRKGG